MASLLSKKSEQKLNLRVLLTLVLAGSILIPLTVPAVRSQTTVTIASVQYSTSSLVTEVYSTIQKNATMTQSISYNLVPYGYSDQTQTFLLTQIMQGPGVFLANYCAYYDYFLFNTIKGHEIRGHFEAYNRPPYAVKEAPVSFYILNLQQFVRFKSSSCWSYDWGWEFTTSASSYDLDWIAPQSGEFALLFLATHLPYYGTISFTARDLAITVQSIALTYTSTRLYTLQSTQLMVSTQRTINMQPSITEYYPFALIGAIIIIGLIILKRRIKPKVQA